MNKLHFKHRIEIIEKKENEGPIPGEEEVLFSKAWAAIKTNKGREHNVASIAGNVGQSRFIIRYMPGVKASMIIKYKGLEYEIKSLENDDEDNRTITMICEAILEN